MSPSTHLAAIGDVWAIQLRKSLAKKMQAQDRLTYREQRNLGHFVRNWSLVLDDPQIPTAVSATGVDEIEAAISGLPLEVSRLTTDAGGVAFSSTVFGDVSVMCGEFGFPVATSGDVAGGALVVALQLEDGPGSWNGEDFSPDRAWIYEPGSEHVGVGRAKPGGRPPRFATISLPAADERHGGSTRATSIVNADRVRALRAVLLDGVASARSGALDAGRALWAGRELTQIIDELRSDKVGARVDRTSAWWITDECRALAESLGPLPSTIDLAAGVGVSDRWVRAAFREVFGVSPSAYFRAIAIEGARRDLRLARPESTSVTEVATRWGFWHLGRFSSTYLAYIGELPSATLGGVE